MPESPQPTSRNQAANPPGLLDLPDQLDPPDLGDPLGLEAASRERCRQEIKHGFLRHAGIFMGVCAVVGGINRVWSPRQYWALALAAAWALVVAAHGLWAWRQWRKS